MTALNLGATLLAGGRSTRMGGDVKPLLEVGGETLLARAVAAVTDARCAPVIVVGPTLDPDAPVRWVREDPPFSGPAAAIAAALAAIDGGAVGEGEPEWMLVLAVDLAHVSRVAARLVAATGDIETAEAAVFTSDGRPQWLAGVYRTRALRTAVHDRGEGIAGSSCRALLGGLEITWLADEDGITADIDTPADLARVRAAVEEEP